MSEAAHVTAHRLAQNVTEARNAWHRAHLTGDPHLIAAATLTLRTTKTALTHHHTQEPT